MSLLGRWTDDPPAVPVPANKPVPKQQQRQSFQPNYADPAVTQFCNEHFKDLNDLQNVDQLIASLNEQQSIIVAQVAGEFNLHADG
jgi:hypothetical protein